MWIQSQGAASSNKSTCFYSPVWIHMLSRRWTEKAARRATISSKKLKYKRVHGQAPPKVSFLWYLIITTNSVSHANVHRYYLWVVGLWSLKKVRRYSTSIYRILFKWKYTAFKIKKKQIRKKQTLFKIKNKFPTLALLSADCWFSHSTILRYFPIITIFFLSYV